MAEGHTSADYGWHDAEPTCAHACLEPVVLQSLRRLGARRILDLGCGNGSLCRTLKDAGFEVAGCDADRQGVEFARAKGPDIRFEVMDIAAAPGRLRGSPSTQSYRRRSSSTSTAPGAFRRPAAHF